MSPEAREALALGRQLFEGGSDEGALAAFTRVLDANPGYADVHYFVGLVHERNGRLDDATSAFERALEINPSYAECLAALGSVYEQSGRYERARELADKLRATAGEMEGALDATTRGKLANLHAALGDAYREAGEIKLAIDEYRKALDRAPGFLDIRQRLGITLRDSGLPSQAIAEFRRALRANPAYLDAAVQLGLTYFTLGRNEEALREWTRVLELDAERADARMYLRMAEGER